MGEQSIQLQVPEALYERVRQIAAGTNRPVESVLIEGLSLIFGELPPVDETSLLETFSDEQLWALVYQPFVLAKDARLRELTALGKSGSLSDEDEKEMVRLLDDHERYVLLRTQALVMLKQRGYDVERRLKLGA